MKIVCLVRSQLRVVTCAIGDGSNDVPMLRVADVSVGLFGKEGRQAVMAADYATGQFRFLRTLLFFHGRESYHRVVLLLLYSFYKGVAFAFLSQWFSIFSLFSGQTLFESWHLAMFHVLFTSVPMIIFAVTDFEVPNKEVALQNPKLYGRDLFSLPLFLSWLLRGLYDSVVVFFVCMAAFGDDSAGALGYGLFSFGIVILTASVLLVNARLALYVTHFTLVMAGAFLLTLILFFGFLVLLSVTSNTGKDQSMYFVSLNVMGLPTFWLSVMLCIVVGLMPDWIWLVFRDQPDTVILNRMEAKK
jgi:magnesium-transporting ATPase (P-type)